MVLNEPLMIAPAKLSAILLVLQDRGDLSKINGLPNPTDAAIKASNGNEPAYLGSGVAVLPIHGSLVHRSMGLSALSGMVSYAQLSNQFAELMADPSIDHIILNVDSHGGHVNGAFDFADEIFSSRADKKITAIVDESAYSAGYLIASAAHEIIVTRTAGVGSIGVITAHADQSAKNEKDGIKVTALFAGARKNDLNPNEPMSDDARAIVENNLQHHYKLFVETIARNRSMSLDEIKNTEAGFFIGESAVSVGLADRVQPARQALSQIVSENHNSRNPPGRMLRAATAMKIKYS